MARWQMKRDGRQASQSLPSRSTGSRTDRIHPTASVLAETRITVSRHRLTVTAAQGEHAVTAAGIVLTALYSGITVVLIDGLTGHGILRTFGLA
jgi:hypothetical protein